MANGDKVSIHWAYATLQTTNATATTAITFTLPTNNQLFYIEVWYAAQNEGAGANAGDKFEALVLRANDGSISIVESKSSGNVLGSLAVPADAISFVDGGSGALQIKVKGIAATNIRWGVRANIQSGIEQSFGG